MYCAPVIWIMSNRPTFVCINVFFTQLEYWQGFSSLVPCWIQNRIYTFSSCTKSQIIRPYIIFIYLYPEREKERNRHTISCCWSQQSINLRAFQSENLNSLECLIWKHSLVGKSPVNQLSSTGRGPFMHLTVFVYLLIFYVLILPVPLMSASKSLKPLCWALTRTEKKSHAESHKDWHMPARVSKPAWLGLFTALINGRLIWWHKWSWQQQKPQTVANPNSSHYHRCMRGAISPLLPDLSLWAFRVVS